MHNPSGDINIARDEDVKIWLPKVWEQLSLVRGEKAVIKGVFAYYIGKRGVWVRRIAAEVYQQCGVTAFNPPHETSGHNKLSLNVFGKPKKLGFWLMFFQNLEATKNERRIKRENLMEKRNHDRSF